MWKQHAVVSQVELRKQEDLVGFSEDEKKQLEKKDKTLTRYCSWCFSKEEHQQVVRSILGRNIYKCPHCFNLCLPCTMCPDGMAKQFESYSDKTCAVCDGTIKSWDQPVSTKSFAQGWCSWCFYETKHSLTQTNVLRRNVYKCDQCGRRTLPCRKCQIALVRGSELYDDEFCSLCDGSIDSWDNRNENLEKMNVHAWCSWCIEQTIHIKEKNSPLGRNIYHCSSCLGRSLPCTICHDGFTRGGIGWDDSLCAHCQGETKSWESLREKRIQVYEQPFSKATIIEQLSKQSEYRQKAYELGMIRPFLLLVTMPPMVRCQVAAHLGWSIFTKDYFGDPHAESFYIISTQSVGICSRSHHSWEKMNPFSSASNWYYILYRVIESIFKFVETSEITYAQSVEACQTRPYDSDNVLFHLEQEFLSKLVEFMKTKLTTQQKGQLRELVSTNYTGLYDKIQKNIGFSDPDIGVEALALVQHVSSLQPEGGGLASMSAAYISNTTAVVLPLSVNLALLATPLLFLGIAGLLANSIRLLLGSSEARLFTPVTLILCQLLLLASEDINLQDYASSTERSIELHATQTTK